MADNAADNKGLHQLLLTPLSLLNEITGVLMPGGLFLSLLGLKGDALLKRVWINAPFGYGTKVTIFACVAFIAGKMLIVPHFLLASVLGNKTSDKVEGKDDRLKGLGPTVQKLVYGAIFAGPLMTAPGLMDRLSVKHANIAFYRGTSAALIIASCIRGDGHLRWLELILGVLAYAAAYYHAKDYSNQYISDVGIGISQAMGRMSTEQMKIALAIINGLMKKARGENPPTEDGPNPTTAES